MTKIYISSTYADLVDFRAVVYRTLRQMEQDSVAMEDYVAADERPVDKCLRDVSNCNLYIGVIGWRYGYVPPEDNPDLKSITQMEYERATALKCPRLLFLVSPSAVWPEEHTDQVTGEGLSGERIRRFREDLCRRHIVSFFEKPDELGRLVSIALHHWQIQTSYVSPVPKLSETLFPKDLRVKNYIPGKSLTVSYRDGLFQRLFSMFFLLLFIAVPLGLYLWQRNVPDDPFSTTDGPASTMCFGILAGLALLLLARRRMLTFDLEKLVIRAQGPGFVQWGPPSVGQLKLITKETRAGWHAKLFYIDRELARTEIYQTREEARAQLATFAIALNYAMGMHSLKES